MFRQHRYIAARNIAILIEKWIYTAIRGDIGVRVEAQMEINKVAGGMGANVQVSRQALCLAG